MASNNKERKDKIQTLKYETGTLIFYEAPHKLIQTLNCMYEVLGNRRVVLARELTKIHEEFKRDTLENIINSDIIPKGEYVILVEGSEKTEQQEIVDSLSEKTLEEHYNFYEKQGLEKKEIIKKIAKDRNVSKNEIYQYFM